MRRSGWLKIFLLCQLAGLLPWEFTDRILAADLYVSVLRGSDSNRGTPDAPLETLEEAIERLESGDTCWIESGVYAVERLQFGPPGRSFDQPTRFKAWDGPKRVVITGPGGEQPRVGLQAFTRIEGLWIGGRPRGRSTGGDERFELEAGSVAFGREGVQIVDCTFFGRGLQLLAGNTSKNVLIRNNRFIHMGQGWFGHPLYLSGGPEPTSQDIRVIGNIFIDGMGFAIHGWHDPVHLTIAGNFTAGHSCSLVAQGPGHKIHHNVFWKPNGKTTGASPRPDWKFCAVLPNDVLRFDHNVCWSSYPVREGGESEEKPVQNYTMPEQGGTQMELIEIAEAELPRRVPWFPRAGAALDQIVREISDYFRQQTAAGLAREPVPEKLEELFDLVRVRYEPTGEDLKSRPYPGNR